VDLERRRRWEDRHRAANAIGTPAPFVVRALDRLATEPPTAHSPRALDLACGRGRHALLLAERGYVVDAVDWALPALTRLARAAEDRRLPIRCVVADVGIWPMPVERYALVVTIDFLDRTLFPALRAAVAPGGALLYETHRRDPHVPSAHAHRPEFLLEPGELDAVCDGWRVLLRHEDAPTVEGTPTPRAGILAQRPRAAPH
jgi:SAM-dependent methyltransferase